MSDAQFAMLAVGLLFGAAFLSAVVAIVTGNRTALLAGRALFIVAIVYSTLEFFSCRVLP